MITARCGQRPLEKSRGSRFPVGSSASKSGALWRAQSRRCCSAEGFVWRASSAAWHLQHLGDSSFLVARFADHLQGDGDIVVKLSCSPTGRKSWNDAQLAAQHKGYLPIAPQVLFPAPGSFRPWRVPRAASAVWWISQARGTDRNTKLATFDGQ